LQAAKENRSPFLEEKHNKDENKGLKAEIPVRQLKKLTTKEREERKVAVAGLEGRLEKCERGVRNTKKQHINDMRDILKVSITLSSFTILIPSNNLNAKRPSHWHGF